jgi:hypothetical protein
MLPEDQRMLLYVSSIVLSWQLFAQLKHDQTNQIARPLYSAKLKEIMR